VAATTDTDFLARVRAALEDDLRHTKARIAGLEHALGDYAEAARQIASDDEHDDDASSMAFDRARTAGLLEAAHEHLDEVASALARLAAGTYGVCESCGQPISEERLEARPIARLCIRCASARQHG
jgi:RNA polymerase-binding transcription factor DksA